MSALRIMLVPLLGLCLCSGCIGPDLDLAFRLAGARADKAARLATIVPQREEVLAQLRQEPVDEVSLVAAD